MTSECHEMSRVKALSFWHSKTVGHRGQDPWMSWMLHLLGRRVAYFQLELLLSMTLRSSYWHTIFTNLTSTLTSSDFSYLFLLWIDLPRFSVKSSQSFCKFPCFLHRAKWLQQFTQSMRLDGASTISVWCTKATEDSGCNEVWQDWRRHHKYHTGTSSRGTESGWCCLTASRVKVLVKFKLTMQVRCTNMCWCKDMQSIIKANYL